MLRSSRAIRPPTRVPASRAPTASTSTTRRPRRSRSSLSRSGPSASGPAMRTATSAAPSTAAAASARRVRTRSASPAARCAATAPAAAKKRIDGRNITGAAASKIATSAIAASSGAGQRRSHGAEQVHDQRRDEEVAQKEERLVGVGPLSPVSAATAPASASNRLASSGRAEQGELRRRTARRRRGVFQVSGTASFRASRWWCGRSPRRRSRSSPRCARRASSSRC